MAQAAGEAEEVHIEEVDADPDYNPASRILEFPGAHAGLVGAIQARLSQMVGKASGYLETLPPKVKARIEALRDLQKNHDDLEADYNKELAALEAKYQALYKPLYGERAKVVSGELEPPAAASAEGEAEKGIPEFWLNVLRADERVGALITEKDEGILKYLLDISTEDLPEEDDIAGYRLTFKFAKNPYFNEELLTKTYYIREDEGGEMELERAEGTNIVWNSGKNPTVKIMKKKPKPGKGGRPGRVLTKEEPTSSFFNFFSPPVLPEDDDEEDEEELEALQEALEEDLTVGELIRHSLIPKAVRYYTGEIIPEDEDDGDDYDEDDEDDEDDDDEDDDDEEDDGRRRGNRRQGGEEPKDAVEKPAECKQQ